MTLLPRVHPLLQWYGQHVRELLQAATDHGRLVVAVSALSGASKPQARLLLCRHGQDRDLGDITLGRDACLHLEQAGVAWTGGRVVVRLPPAAVLERQITLPLAAETNLAQRLRTDIDQLTPFRADMVCYGWAITERQHQFGMLHVRLWLVQREATQPAITACLQAGLQPICLESRMADGELRRIPLPTAPPASVRPHAACAFILAGALLALAAVPLAEQATDRRIIERHIAALRPLAAEAQALRADLARRRSDEDPAERELARAGDIRQLLATVTAALPDGTWLTELRIDGTRLDLAGETTEAAQLIKLLSAMPTMHDPTFTAPVIHDAHRQTDRFSISTHLALGAEAAPAVP